MNEIIMDDLLNEQMEEHFEITDDGKAEWAVKKIVAAKCEMEYMKSYYAEQYERIEKRCNGTIETMKNLLYSYFNTVPESAVKATKGGTFKYALPSATLTLKPASLDFERDKAQLLEWAKANAPDCVKVSEKAEWSKLKKRMTETGEIPGGVTVKEKPAEFEVKINA